MCLKADRRSKGERSMRGRKQGRGQRGCSQACRTGWDQASRWRVGLGAEGGWLLQKQKEEQREDGCRCRCRFAVGC